MDKIYQTIDIIIVAQKKARQNNDYLTLMSNAEALLEFVPSLIGYCVEQESQYRKYEAKLSNENDLSTGKKLSSSYCETQAKATDYYKEWQKVKMFLDFIYEMVNMSKKLAGTVDKEMSLN